VLRELGSDNIEFRIGDARWAGPWRRRSTRSWWGGARYGPPALLEQLAPAGAW